MAIEITPVTPTIGAEVRGVDLSQPLERGDLAVVEQALYDHLVLFFRDQHDLDPASQCAFAAHFGPFERHPFARPHPDFGEVVVLDQTTPERDGANNWHSDSSFMERPAFGSVLRAVQLPPQGGDTIWASMHAAYEALSPLLRELLEQCSAMHDIVVPLERAVREGHSIAGVDEVRAQWPAVRHPVVRTHPVTGRKILYVNSNFATRICELGEAESRAMLDFLFAHLQRPEFQVRLHWEPGTVAFWDNRCTQHYAVPDYTGHRRVMHRVTLEGERPVGTVAIG
jgi:taurine dioxygenase